MRARALTHTHTHTGWVRLQASVSRHLTELNKGPSSPPKSQRAFPWVPIGCPWGRCLTLSRLPRVCQAPACISPALGHPGTTLPQPTHPESKQTALNSHYPSLGTPLGKSRALGRKGAAGLAVAFPDRLIAPGLSPKDRGPRLLLCSQGSLRAELPAQPGTQGPGQGRETQGQVQPWPPSLEEGRASRPLTCL